MRLSLFSRSARASTNAAPRTRTVRHCAFAAITIALTASHAPAQPAADPSRPQLVVLITVDQLRPDYLTRWRSEFTGGLARFMKQGAFFTNASHDHAVTETAPGHASLGSGRHPRSTGIVRNDAGVSDPQAPLIDGGRGGGASPDRFRGTSLFDWMRSIDQWARGLSVSRTDLGAILPIGRAKQSAFWYSTDGRFVTSRYYADTLPSWVRAFNERDFIGALQGARWTTRKPASAYPEPDSVRRENSGRDFVFPHLLPDSAARRALMLTEYPVMDSLTVQLALAGIDAMKLGAGSSTDFIGLSLSTTDAIGHRYGPDSREVHDQLLSVDHYLGQFIDSLFRTRDSSRILFAISSDHGVAPYPELTFVGTDSARGRVDIRPTMARGRSALAAFG
ncbi:MAG: alkaline phosphatase family protein, partial [Draconibacterium sp.]|nr:alkaline phosphatase family protein [Draconibacterium sp.]